MTDGKFATRNDVTSRFEGDFPSDRLAWVDLRIADVESELMWQVPSLRKMLDQITADSAAVGDADRLNRVKTVVADKVLDLFRNPQGPMNQVATTMPDITTSRSFAPDPTRGKVEFSDAELNKVRLITPRTRFGTIQVSPARITCNPWFQR